MKLGPYKDKTSTVKETRREQIIPGQCQELLEIEILVGDHLEGDPLEGYQEEIRQEEARQEEIHHVEAHQPKETQRTMTVKETEPIQERSAVTSISLMETGQKQRSSKWNSDWLG